MSEAASALASFATAGGAILVLLLYLPALQAPFLAPKFAALELAASLGIVAFALRRASTGRPRWARGMTASAWLVLATTAASSREPASPHRGAPRNAPAPVVAGAVAPSAPGPRRARYPSGVDG